VDHVADGICVDRLGGFLNATGGMDSDYATPLFVVRSRFVSRDDFVLRFTVSGTVESRAGRGRSKKKETPVHLIQF
jgi:hypothetical protein